jgi:adenylate cyclase
VVVTSPRYPTTYVAATDVLAGRADPRVLGRGIVLVGATAAGLLDLRATPVQNVFPGVEINANLVAGLPLDSPSGREDTSI